MDRQNALYRVFKRNKSTVSWEAFKRNRVTALQWKGKKEYFHHLFKKKVSPSSLWNIHKLLVLLFLIPIQTGLS